MLFNVVFWTATGGKGFVLERARCYLRRVAGLPDGAPLPDALLERTVCHVYANFESTNL